MRSPSAGAFRILNPNRLRDSFDQSAIMEFDILLVVTHARSAEGDRVSGFQLLDSPYGGVGETAIAEEAEFKIST